MKLTSLWAMFLVLALAGFLPACSDNNSGPCINCPTDGGDGDDGGSGRTPCVDDSDCEAPDTCQEDGYCDWVLGPKPNKNRLAGSFNIYMNPLNDTPSGECRVTGLMDGMSVYMEFGYAVFDSSQDPDHAVLFFYGPLTNDLYRFISIEVPRQTPLETPVEFKAGGLASGLVELVLFDENFDVQEETPEAEAVDGQVTFGSFGINAEDSIEGTFIMDLRPVD